MFKIKRFLTLWTAWTTEWENLTASVIPAPLKPFLIISGCLQRYLNISTIHCTCSGLSSERANDTFTSASFIPLTSYFVTSSLNQALYLLAIINLAGLLTVMSVDWNLFVRLCGMITMWQKFSLHKSFITCPLNVCIMINDDCSLRQIKVSLTSSEYGNIISSNSSMDII